MKMVFYAYFASLCQENSLLDLHFPVLSSGKSCEWKQFRRAVSQSKTRRSLQFLIHFQISLMYFHFIGTIVQNLVLQCSSNLSVVLPKDPWLDLNCHLLSLLLVNVFMSWAQNLFTMYILDMNSQSVYMLTSDSYCLHF